MHSTARIAPRVSVVIPCYNYERYVGLAIESALKQSLAPNEIIVVDDGSTDGSASVIARFPEVRYLFQKNQGHVAAFNHGYAHSAGDIVLFLDADDHLDPKAIGEVVRHWQAGCAKLQYELNVIDENGQPLGRHFCNYPAGYDSRSVREEFGRFGTYQWPVCTGNAYARWFLDKLMPLQVTIAPDGFLNTLAPVYGDVVVVDKVLGHYRLHTQNQSYHGTDKNRMDLRFTKQIGLRASEFVGLREHARHNGVALPDNNLLDNEIVFINYRLMVKKLGGRYEGMQADTVRGLYWQALLQLLARPLRARTRWTHWMWFSALALSPRPLARALIMLRFNRAQYLQRFRRPAVAPQPHA
ncbi:MAG TPA: glycosyltransferase family A protein [Rhizobacter sp.]|nr:glycosyltransferase family A protein [Rhizobacter sp.]